MKVGDKVYCKRDFTANYIDLAFNRRSYFYKKDNGYIVTFVTTNENGCLFILIDQVIFCSNITNSLRHFDDYFYTKQELRKEKLKKLNMVL